MVGLEEEAGAHGLHAVALLSAGPREVTYPLLGRAQKSLSGLG